MLGWYLYLSNKVDSLFQEIRVKNSQQHPLLWGKP
ncbi:hypothetical protein EDF78_107119 [Rahnella sp. BIGb0236]|jgi:hypothetical protein|nr:hypothetical protein EDF78_107119 [Rahnella sp. BIGb0236]VTQ53213.1 Uncharacterised protein [Campylobacter jejuni]